MNRAYKFRIYPNKGQRIMFAKTFGCVRFIYNRMLADKIKHYQETGEALSVTPVQYKGQYEWLKEVDSLALANAQMNLQTAYRNFFSKPRVGFPKFKSKKSSRKRYTTNNQHDSIRIEGGKIKLPKVGYVKIVQHRPMMGVIKSVTVEQTPTNKYFVSILVEYEKQVPEVELKKFIGLEYEKITNQRKNYLHKKSYHLAEEYDAVCIEALDVRTLSRLLRFGKSVSDNSFGKLREMLRYKLYDRGKKLVVVDKWYASSQLCSVCGYKNGQVKDLSIRSWKCPSCGTNHDRDINAAINICEEGKRLVAATVGYTGSNACGEGVRLPSTNSVMEQSSLKQEAPAS